MGIPENFKLYADQVADTARWAARKGWAPATSTNYSVRLPPDAAPAICAITASGIDKDHLGSDSVIAIDGEGHPMNGNRLRPSAETPLHLMLYRRTHIGAVLHTHSIAGALLSRSAEATGYLAFSGWELLKGLEGIDRHDCEVRLPVFPNSQDMAWLSSHIEPRLPQADPCYGFLLAGHGLYVWGTNLADAKRHLEVFEYLLQCEREVRTHGYLAGA
ncbi:MAG: methylthioribulose 1-phosphate dehydratase [Nitrospira sp.]|nr:methylthioribulose 1-phosphate dehydratase [Nitrospira sp.]